VQHPGLRGVPGSLLIAGLADLRSPTGFTACSGDGQLGLEYGGLGRGDPLRGRAGAPLRKQRSESRELVVGQAQGGRAFGWIVIGHAPIIRGKASRAGAQSTVAAFQLDKHRDVTS
jgi:hypothetical protein